MDVPISGPSAQMKLRRTCEHNRLEKQFLIDAYECLAPIVEHDDFRSGATLIPSQSVAGNRAGRPGGLL